tara:strand:- start:1850 stop:2026 length:177 start_codon:yes stop_codon:yes gene_type:complete
MSKLVPIDLMNDWGHNDLDGFANYIGTPVEHVKQLAKKNQEEINKANTADEVDDTESN